MALLAHKTAMQPTQTQKKVLNQHCDFARNAYNAALSDFKTGLDNGEFCSVYDLKKLFNARKREVFPEIDGLSMNVGKNAIHNFHDAVKRWQSGQNNFPKRKKHNSRSSFQMDNGVGSVKVSANGKHVILPKIGKVRLAEKPRWTGQVRRAVISRTAHRWWISMLFEVDEPEPPNTSGTDPTCGVIASHLPAEGCDVGVAYLAKLSDGTTFENPRALRVHERKLKRLNRSLSRKTYRSSGWWKAKELLARLHLRIRNIRMDAHHQATHRILQGISALGIESLSVKGLMKNRKLSKALADASLGGFLVKLKYKAVRRGIRIVEADRFWPSTKRCSSCGYVKKKVSLSERDYHCGVCGYQADRDVNAAMNLKQLASSTDERINAVGASVSPTQVGWTCGRRKVKPNQMIINFATA